MKKLCISLFAALVITVTGQVAPLGELRSNAFFLPSQSVELKQKRRKQIKIVRPDRIEFSLAIGELFKKIFG